MKADPFTTGLGMAFTTASSVFPLVRNEVARYSNGYITFNKYWTHAREPAWYAANAGAKTEYLGTINNDA